MYVRKFKKTSTDEVVFEQEPNDERARDVQDFTHLMYLKTLNGLSLAPLPLQLHNVLDVGTGTGTWALNFADQHPEASVVGVDISLMPTWTAVNCKFEIDDLTRNWTWERGFFEFIHFRGFSGCIPDDGMDTFSSNL
jgi:tRNA G46 methylase TrmB